MSAHLLQKSCEETPAEALSANETPAQPQNMSTRSLNEETQPEPTEFFSELQQQELELERLKNQIYQQYKQS